MVGWLLPIIAQVQYYRVSSDGHEQMNKWNYFETMFCLYFCLLFLLIHYPFVCPCMYVQLLFYLFDLFYFIYIKIIRVS